MRWNKRDTKSKDSELCSVSLVIALGFYRWNGQFTLRKLEQCFVMILKERNLPQSRSLAPDEEQCHGSGKSGKKGQAGGHSSPPTFFVVRYRCSCQCWTRWRLEDTGDWRHPCGGHSAKSKVSLINLSSLRNRTETTFNTDLMRKEIRLNNYTWLEISKETIIR